LIGFGTGSIAGILFCVPTARGRTQNTFSSGWACAQVLVQNHPVGEGTTPSSRIHKKEGTLCQYRHFTQQGRDRYGALPRALRHDDVAAVPLRAFPRGECWVLAEGAKSHHQTITAAMGAAREPMSGANYEEKES